MPRKKKRRRGRAFLIALLFFIGVLVAARVAMPRVLRWYVNRTIDQNPLYDGKIGDIDVALWRGAYTIKDIRLVKTTGNVPVPFYSSRQLDLALQWDALLHGKLVGRVLMQEPELNFVDAPSDAQTQTGAGGPWLKIIQDLFPFRINRAQIVKGSIHFRAYQSQQPVDVYLSHLDANIDNLSNIRDQTAPLISTITAQGMAMDQANFEFNMKLDPFSYRPTFRMGLKLVGLDVTKTNALARSYGAFDFEKGYFDLVVEMDARHGAVEGYVKPLFRDLVVVSVQDVKEDNPVQLFWEAVVGTVTGVLTNQPRHQFGTLIPVRGDLEGGPQFNILATVGNVLRNAFIRAYLPRLNGSQNVEGLEFKPGSVDDPVTSAELNGR
ncbi:MAG TPA: DUF748 domain-containing protein [Tepidisphaeraceae bacterium]